MDINRRELECGYSTGGFFVQTPAGMERCRSGLAGRGTDGAAPGEVEVAVEREAGAAPEKALPTETHGGIRAEHRALWARVKKKLVRGMRRRELKVALEELKVAKVAAEVLTIVVKGERQAWGIDYAGSEIASDDTEEIVKEMASLTVPSGTDKALDGE